MIIIFESETHRYSILQHSRYMKNRDIYKTNGLRTQVLRCVWNNMTIARYCFLTVMSPHGDYTQRKRVAACCTFMLFSAQSAVKERKKVRCAASSDALALRVVAMWGHHGKAPWITSLSTLNGVLLRKMTARSIDFPSMSKLLSHCTKSLVSIFAVMQIMTLIDRFIN